MTDRPRQFTFIDVTAHQPANKKRIKSHVANDTNRKKRQTAVKEYQDSLLQQTGQQIPTDDAPSSTVKSTTLPEVKPEGSSRKRLLPPTLYDNTKQALIKQHKPILRTPEIELDSWSVFTAAVSRRETTLNSAWNIPGHDRPILLKRSSSDNSADSIPSIGNQSPSSDYVPASIPRIDPPTQLGQTDVALRHIQGFFRGKYESTWVHCLKENPYHYQHDYEIGIWRECFFLAFDQLQAERSVTALTILDAALGATSALLKKQHPSLLYALLEIMQEARCVKDRKLSRMLQSYLAKMATYILGPGHPITNLIDTVTLRSEAQIFPETLFQVAIDALADSFGRNDFHTIGQKFGSARRHRLAGDLKSAQGCLKEVEDVWSKSFPANSMPLHVLYIEKARMTGKESETITELDHVLYPAVQALEQLAILSQRPLPPESGAISPDKEPVAADLPPTLTKLGNVLMRQSHFALSLHVYTHVEDVFTSVNTKQGELSQTSGTDFFATKVAKIVLHSIEDHPID